MYFDQMRSKSVRSAAVLSGCLSKIRHCSRLLGVICFHDGGDCPVRPCGWKAQIGLTASWRQPGESTSLPRMASALEDAHVISLTVTRHASFQESLRCASLLAVNGGEALPIITGDRTNIASRYSPGGTSNDLAGSLLYVQRISRRIAHGDPGDSPAAVAGRTGLALPPRFSCTDPAEGIPAGWIRRLPVER